MKTKAPLYVPAEVSEHLIRATSIEQTFRIRVLQPIRRSDSSERFPVLYATDGDEFFGAFSALLNSLQLAGEIPRIILVSIGYEESRLADLLRFRDLFTHDIRRRFLSVIHRLAQAPLYEGIGDLNAITQSTDANDFLAFVCAELTTLIDKNYPTVLDNRSYVGYSAGGTFGLHALFSHPQIFARYLIGSPATSYDGDHFGIDMAMRFVASGRALIPKVFMSVGDLEEFYGQFDLTTGFLLMTKFLRNANIAGLDLTTQLFLGETHATAWMPAFSHGLKALYGPAASVPFWPNFEKAR